MPQNIGCDTSIIFNVNEKVPILYPVGHQSTNLFICFCLTFETAAETVFECTSPRYMRQQAIYLKNSHFEV